METQNELLQYQIQQYLSTLDEKKILAYQIAKSQLGTSFQLEKSNDFLEWCSQFEKKKST